MRRIAKAWAWLRGAVDSARVQNERDDLLTELDDVILARGDLRWQLDLADKREREIRARLRALDGSDRRAPSLAGDVPAPTPSKNVHELQARFADKHPKLAEELRLRRAGDFHSEYRTSDLPRVAPSERVEP